MITLDERVPSDEKAEELNARKNANKLRVAIPGIIQSFNPAEQTVEVQCALRESINNDGNLSWVEIPLLVDVPISLPRAGGYVLTMPIKKGDECVVLFNDMCIDAWWQSGGVQNQIDLRRHDLSDATAIIGLWSQPRIIPNYSTSSVQLRNDAGSAYVEIAGNAINIKAGSVNIDAGNVNIGGSTTIDGKQFLPHVHTGVMTGGGNTGGVG